MPASAQILRGGWEGAKPGYTVSHQTAGNAPNVEQLKFTGLDDELLAFVDQVCLLDSICSALRHMNQIACVT